MSMLTINDYLKHRKVQLNVVHPFETVYEGIKKLSDLDVGALVVMSDGKLYGIFSERDYTRKIILKGRTSVDTFIHEVMQTDIYFIQPDQAMEECLSVMAKLKIRHIPVIDEKNKVLAFLNIKEVAEAVIDEKENSISHLTKYITGSSYDFDRQPRVQKRDMYFQTSLEASR